MSANFRIRVEFSPSVNLVDAANDVREAVSRVERELPDGVEDIFVIKADADASPIMQLSVYSERLTIEDLTSKVRDEIVPEIMSVDGVADVALFGEAQSRIMVSVTEERAGAFEKRADGSGVPCVRLGTVGGDRLRVGRVDVGLADAEAVWSAGLARALAGEG